MMTVGEGGDVSHFIRQREHTARRNYRCEACSQYFRMRDDEELVALTPEQQAVVDAAVADGCIVKKGQRYVRWTAEYEGEIGSVAMRPEMAELVTKLGLWEEE
jgi:hypothetical protein